MSKKIQLSNNPFNWK